MDPQQIKNHPAFLEMTRRRLRMTFILTAVLLLNFCLFFVLLAWWPQILEMRIVPASPINFGFWLAFFIVIFSVLASGFYVWWANTRFDNIKKKLLDELKADV